jgi:short-subunit dehydrogenase
MQDLAGRCALLTGASSGLGPVIARRLGREGVRLVLSSRRQPELEALAVELGEARIVPADLARLSEAERLAAEAGPVDIFISNAGVPANGNLPDLEVEHIDRALTVNLRSPMVLTRLLLPMMVERGSGHVVLMASLAGRVPTAGSSVYDSTKFAMRGFGFALRAELRGTGVGVSLVSPTFVSDVGMWAETGVRSRIGLASPDQVAEACVRAIREDRAEVAVAPLVQRVASQLALLFPDRMQPFLGSAAVPEEVIRRQESKR